jgi:hypothetical protein
MGNLCCHGAIALIGHLITDKGIHMREIARLGWLTGFVKHTTWDDSFKLQNPSFIPDDPMTPLIRVLGYVCSSRTYLKLYICSQSHTPRGLPISPM